MRLRTEQQDRDDVAAAKPDVHQRQRHKAGALQIVSEFVAPYIEYVPVHHDGAYGPEVLDSAVDDRPRRHPDAMTPAAARALWLLRWSHPACWAGHRRPAPGSHAPGVSWLIDRDLASINASGEPELVDWLFLVLSSRDEPRFAAGQHPWRVPQLVMHLVDEHHT